MDTEKRPFIPLSEEQKELRSKMLAQMRSGSIKAVSFKMSDVLVITPFSDADDIFVQLGNEMRDVYTFRRPFTEMRAAAQAHTESRCRKKGAVTLEKIYARLQKTAKLSDSVRDRLMQRECEIAEYYSMPRVLGKEMLLTAKAHSKKVIIIADSIYPRDVIVRILNSCGLGCFDELVIPHELNIPFEDAHSAIDAAILKANVPAGKLLHIGPDVGNDVEVPILRGQKAVILSPVTPLMVRSGRLRGAVQAKHLLDTNGEEHLALRCLFGLYAAYCFDIPRNKTVHSDFCSSSFMLGFIVLGGLSLCTDFTPANDLQRELISAMESSRDFTDGRDAFRAALSLHFRDHLGKYGFKDCHLPLIFLEKHCAPADRGLLRPLLSAETFQLWETQTSEPVMAPVYFKKARKNALYRLADRLFPPGTRVRTLADGMLTKMHR